MFKKLLNILCFLLISLFNSNAVTFTGLGTSGFRSLYNAYHIEADFNNDGYMDVLVAGNDGSADYTEIYLNNKNSTFTLLPSAIPSLSNVSADVADFNSDGYIDIVISGLNAGQKYCKIFKNNGDNTFTAITSPVENVALGAMLWADFNNDGILDLLTCGVNQSGNYVSRMYKGGNNTFTLVSTNIIPISGKAIILDYNNDSFTDIALTGYNSSGQIVSYLFKNKRNFNFESVNAGFERITSGGLAASDIDADGDADVIMTGLNHLGKKVSQLYINASGIFTRSVTANLDSLSSSSIDVADVDNDGFADILLTGTDNKGFYQTILYINNKDNTFTRNSTLFPSATLASAAIADFDNDNDADILLSGKTYTGNLVNQYSNNSTVGNITPSVPASLSATTVHDSVTLAWAKASDDETPANGLSYNLYLGTASGTYDLLAPAASLANGNRKVMRAGNAPTNFWKLYGLPEGKYYWSVQSIDNNYKGSAFAAEKSFTVCHNLFVGQDTTVCLGDTVTLHAGSITDVVNWYSLSKGLLAANTRQLTHQVKVNDRIIVELTNKWGCTLHDTIDLKIIQLPAINLGKDTAICYQSSITLKAGSGWKKIYWLKGTNQLIASDTSQYKYTVDANATFTVAVTDNKGCRNRDTINVLKNDLPVFTVGADKAICFNDSAKLFINKSFPDVKWYKINNNSVLSSLVNYNYKVVETDTLLAKVIDVNGCKNNDTVIVKMLLLPDIKLRKDTSVCFGEELTLTSNKKFNHITWYSANLSSPVTDTTLIRFKVKVNDQVITYVSDAYGCMNADTVIITKLDLPIFNIGPDTANCVGVQVSFNAKPGWKRVDWYKTGNNLILADNWYYKHTIAENTKIWARVADKNNCVNYDTANITAHPLPIFSLGKDTSLCKDKILKLVTNVNYKSTLWKSAIDGIILNGPNSIDIKVEQNDEITAEVLDSHSCRNTDTIKVNMFPPPYLDLGPDTTICFNTRLSLNAGTNWKNISWTKKSTGTIYNTAPVYENVYSTGDTLAIHVVDINNCNTSDTFAIRIASQPKFSLGRDTSICAGKSLTFSVTNDYNVKWYSAGSGFLQNGNVLSKFTPQVTDTLVAIANSAQSCQGKDSIIITVNALPLVDAGSDTIVCYGSSITLGGQNTAAGNAPFVYSWTPQAVVNNNVSNPVIQPKEDKTWFLKVTDRFGCENKDSVKVQVNPPTKLQLPKELAICRGQKISLGQAPLASGSKYPYSFNWSPDSTLSANQVEVPVASPKVAASYRLIVSTWKCPADTAYVKVWVRDLPVPYVSPTLTVGNEGSVQLYAEGGVRYRWNPTYSLNKSDIPDPMARPEVSTSYTVEVIDSFGCSAEAKVQVNVRNEVFIPELFTPNGDGKNDEFKIYGFGIVKLSFVIYDKYNNKVFESIDVNELMTKGWDGTYKGKPLEIGVYRWVIEGHFASGQAVLPGGKNTGVITLIR